MYGINDLVYNKLIEYFNGNKDIIEVIIFGSRAKGNYSNNSDIDLCIKYVGKYKGTLVNEIEDIVGIYSCDILFDGNLNDEIKYQISRDGNVIYKK